LFVDVLLHLQKIVGTHTVVALGTNARWLDDLIGVDAIEEVACRRRQAIVVILTIRFIIFSCAI
jgi:hypothetical protein